MSRKHKEWPVREVGAPIYSAADQPFVPTHRHYKGGLYQKLFDAYKEATITPVVVYRGADGMVWVRTREDFEGETEKHSGIARFRALADHE